MWTTDESGRCPLSHCAYSHVGDPDANDILSRMTVTRGELFIDSGLADDFRLQTQNLDLIPAGKQLADVKWQDRDRLSQLLNADVPDEWPPELVKDDNSPHGEGWWDWYVVKRDARRSTLIGMAGLKGWPQVSRAVQMGCAFLPQFQKQGFGTEAVDGLTSWALRQPQIERVTANTPVGNYGAPAVLRRLGFAQVDSADPALLRFEKTRLQTSALGAH
jgi:ribosomal-protein-alanine N-acetyltransferase